MSTDHTQRQSFTEQQRSRDLSQKRSRPPSEVPGYAWRHFLGSGAYGEVWVAVDQNTGRRVAIKFYTHRRGVDWPLLSREVEKLVFLSADRYVVQLLDVGWDAQPPYYVMEYIENGSLEEYLQQHGPLPVGEAVELFREIATGLLHAHGKGVLHCDLKPANVLLDQDHKPRLADFGQSRLSHEQTPALGTLFYMAPEQANLESVPDARWDVYALGAMLYCMLTGHPPHRTEAAVQQIESAHGLDERLQRYCRLIRTAPPPNEHRQVAGMDNALATLIDRCLITDPEQRVGSVQSVLEALATRDLDRDRRPLIMLGLVGPLLFLLVAVLFAWTGFNQAVKQSDRLLFQRAQESNRFAADFVAEAVARRIESYFRRVEEVALDPELQRQVLAVTDDPQLRQLLDQLANPAADPQQVQQLRQTLLEHPLRQPLQRQVRNLLFDPRQRHRRPEIASWFVSDSRGIHLAAQFDTPNDSPVGKDWSFRTYFHGGAYDLSRRARPPAGQHITRTSLSAVFKSQATGAWKIAVSTPIVDPQGRFRGIVALTVELGRLGELLGGQHGGRQFNVLIDGRDGRSKGVILQHPLFTQLLTSTGSLPEEFSTSPEYRVPLERWTEQQVYTDPLSRHPLGRQYARPWIASARPVRLEPHQPADPLHSAVDTGLMVLVQENYDLAAAPVRTLGKWLLRQGLFALATLAAVIVVLWYFVARALRDPNEAIRRQGGLRPDLPSLRTMETLELPQQLRGKRNS